MYFKAFMDSMEFVLDLSIISLFSSLSLTLVHFCLRFTYIDFGFSMLDLSFSPSNLSGAMMERFLVVVLLICVTMSLGERKTIDLEQGCDFMHRGIMKLKNILKGLPELQFIPEDYMMLYTTIYITCALKSSS
ncbi:uncharacterized protein LOC131600338 [Vicia villosa]|uniref:uncharacterized protein LOC131600338 n=1 Tax=Vicia villosa TaxID=3911 RepID=UPI00273C4F00|nr:uncharacterized protein LOC131600338 [Vicia villosa]